ncbi:PREDICTED: phospholipase A2 inhibitor subunit gamma B-like [Nanorana parkeri]|uniref:phospholipase A2 inhibitor subunit gamma B-like n=1 Tax=Nanorana parkeri TaxID=125878 RepID=UPI00085491F5|nr:PREDICTED: phospholipase A2 inhibitor subunit gamma B-like [Nanorana parkeri]
MKPYLKLLWILSIFAKSGHSLSCTSCLVQGATFCTGNNVSCPSGRVCAATHTINMEDGVKKDEYFGRSCVPEGQCQRPGIFSTYNSKSKKGISCCYTDNCTPTQPQLLPDDDKPNGLTCPTCKANGTQWCDTEMTMKCTGEETRCIVQYSKITGPGAQSTERILRGCATPSICSIGNQTHPTDGLSAEVQITCTGSVNGLHHHFNLHGIMAVVMMLLLITA